MRFYVVLGAMTAISPFGLRAQAPIAPTPETVGRARGDDAGGYNIVNSFELGYRLRSVGGNLGKYRSDVNYGNGVRLLSSNLTVHSKEGHGRYFDDLALTTLGLGNDPYQSAVLRLAKNRWYRYDLLWRQNEYFNPALTISSGRHAMNVRRRLQDHDLTLFPQSKLRFLFGYSRNRQDGPALATVQQFGAHQDEFPLFTEVRRQRNEYRAGGELNIRRTKITFVRGWENFKEDTTGSLTDPSPGDNTADRIALRAFRRSEPYHGNTPFSRAVITSEPAPWFTLHARASYAISRRDFVLDEYAVGSDRFGADRSRQILVSGSGRRPVATANLTLNLFPAESVTISNHTAFHHSRMEGEHVYSETVNSAPGFTSLPFQYLGVRTLANTTDLNWRLTPRLTAFAGYQFSKRRIRSREQAERTPSPDDREAEQENSLHTILAGVRLRPARPLTVNVDGEIGRASTPFYPVSEKNYHALGGRLGYRSRSLQLTAYSKANYNANSNRITAHSSRSRHYAAAGSWNASSGLALEAGYTKMHLDTVSGVAYFAAGRATAGASLFASNMQVAHAGVRIGVAQRADLFAGYQRVQDAGDGRRAAGADAIAAAQVLPMRYHSPSARLSVRLKNKLRWNAGYQYYGYGEEFSPLQGYRGHTGFTSLLWSF